MSATQSSATGRTPEDEYLFSEDKLRKLSNWTEISTKLGKNNLRARPLSVHDYDSGYVELLSKLTLVGNVTKDNYIARFDRMKKVNELEDHYIIVVIEDTATKKVIAASTLFLELKFIHECSIRGRLEDVIVDDSYRGKNVGLVLVGIIVALAKESFNCYKLSLDCTDKLIKFYEKNNFKHNLNMLSIRFDERAE